MNKDTEQLQGKKAGAFSDVPEGYFHQLYENISNRISENDKEIHKRDFWPGAIAAAFLILLATGTFLLFVIQPIDKEEIALIIDSSSNAAVDGKLLSLSNETLPEINTNYPKHDLSKQLPEPSINDSSLFQDISFEEMMSYLIEKEEFEF
jgi:hypothetical protein